MISKMLKMTIAVRKADRKTLLKTLQELSQVHLKPVRPEKLSFEEDRQAEIQQAETALQILSAIPPAASELDLPAHEAVRETVRMQTENVELNSRLDTLYLEAERLKPWGEVRLDDLRVIHEGGLDVEFFIMPLEDMKEIEAECVCLIKEYPQGAGLVGVINHNTAAELPDSVEHLPRPNRDRHEVLAEAAEVDRQIKQNNNDLARLVHKIPAIREYYHDLVNQKRFVLAERGGYDAEDLFALQGWIPAGDEVDLNNHLQQQGIPFAMRVTEPDPEEQPPTKIIYPGWAYPIKALFNILGTVPGYREVDLSPFFMIALPFFAAMLTSDAGYGLLFMLPCLFWYKKLSTSFEKAYVQLVIVVGAATFIWGMLNANIFGITPDTIALIGGFKQGSGAAIVGDTEAMRVASGIIPAIGRAMMTLGPLWNADSDYSRELLIKISLMTGSIHLILAHLRQVMKLWPQQKAFAEIGWMLFLAGMLGVIWKLFFPNNTIQAPNAMIIVALAGGAVLFIGFGIPVQNPVKRLGLGFISSLLPMINTFSDTMSYIRLMAVGLASYYIAAAFNSLGAQIAASSVWLWLAAAPIILFGHLLNIALCLIAIFAHGVRLNMLEFSSNAGVQWAGYAYEPFSRVS